MVWMAWLERRAHNEVDAIETPIGFIPVYEDLRRLFKELIDKDYPEALYAKQFSIYADNILSRIALQLEAYSQEDNTPQRLFDILQEQQRDLMALKEACGPIVTPTAMESYQAQQSISA